jgi:FO synthase subunit 2
MKALSDSTCEDMLNDSGDRAELNRDLMRFLWRNPMRLFSLSRRLQESCCGREVTYVINRNINFTNICVGRCRFCAFRKSDGYILTHEEIVQRAKEAEQLGATEICLQGGLAPGLTVEDYCEILEVLKSNFPRMHLHAYSPMEVMHMSRCSGVDVHEALRSLMDSGLDSMPGTAAELLVDSVRKVICPEKLSTSEWSFIIKAAHAMGIPTTSTMLYGHIESFEERLTHLEIIRSIQMETGGFTEFVLLPFVPGNTELGRISSPPDILENLKMHALARVALHPYITNIQASWVKLGREVAGAAIEWGANDLGGTLMEENISRCAGSKEGQYMSPDEFQDLIKKHGRVPTQRDTLYRRILR